MVPYDLKLQDRRRFALLRKDETGSSAVKPKLSGHGFLFDVVIHSNKQTGP